MATKLSTDWRYRLNAACPYFTMFPLEFPITVLRGRKYKARLKNQVVLDPFCGRGTTNFAARALGVTSFGIDSSPVAVAIARAKLATTTVEKVVNLAAGYIEDVAEVDLPQGPFWRLAYHDETLFQICQIRHGLQRARASNDAVMLRALMMGCLHGPLAKSVVNAGYFSNQMPRTYAPKPAYATRFWRRKSLKPPKVDVLRPLRKKAMAALSGKLPFCRTTTNIANGDSRNHSSFDRIEGKVTDVVTSPPYYGLRTYVEDQWLRNWFLGGPTEVPYGEATQVSHESPEAFALSLAKVWDNIGRHAHPDLLMVIRFGAIRSRTCDPREIIAMSLSESAYAWRIQKTRSIGSAHSGKRQADTMGAGTSALTEYDFYVRPS